MSRFFTFLVLCITLCTPFFFESCTNKGEKKIFHETSSLLYKNHIDTAKYIGAEECKKCHQSIYNEYMETEMGHSLKIASLDHSVANFHQQAPIYDSYKNMYYLPFSKGEKLYIKEFRLSKNKKDTVYQRTEEISYIIGSGQHTNSHLMQVNGFIHQMPLTYYAQKGEWHLPPGFENGGNTSFDRSIEVECMTCHNGYAAYVKGSKNKYTYVPEGIDCERCHGPGSIHKKEKMDGDIIDIEHSIDYSIVNPKKLSSHLQMDVCQRCHLQGISVLKKGKTFYDFKPGMKLNDFFEVYQSRFTDSLSSFLMASHPDRLRMSSCYIESNKDGKNGLTCITCHNPHKSVREVSSDYFNAKCNSCHENKNCSEQESIRMKKDNNCVACHMNKSPSYDIPHVNITDHNIVKRPIVPDFTKNDITKSEFEKQKNFIRLVCRTSENPNDKLNAIAYLNYYEKYAFNPLLLNQAEEFLAKYPHKKELDDIYIRLYFLQEKYSKIEKTISKMPAQNIQDEWTAYRIGQALLHLNKPDISIDYLKKAVEIAPYHIDFIQKLAQNYMELGQSIEAETLLRKAVKLYPKNASIQNDLGFAIVLNTQRGKGDLRDSEVYFKNALSLDPDIISAMENITSLYLNINEKEKAQYYLERLTKTTSTPEKYNSLRIAIKAL